MNDSNLVEEEERDDKIVAVALRWSLVVFAILGLAGVAIAVVYNRSPEVVTAPPKAPDLPTVREKPTVPLPKIPFTDITDSSGITFRHENGAAGEKLLPETMGGGCAFVDFDGDGDQDIL